MMKKLLSTIALALLWAAGAEAKLQVATTTTDLAALVRAVAGDKVDVFAIAKGTQDPHQIEAKPSFMVKLRSVDLVITQGLELEAAWITPLIQGARNPKIQTAGGVLELGPLLEPIEVQGPKVTRAEGDVHPGGNPHFQLDPVRLGKAAVLIANQLSTLSTVEGDKTAFVKNAEAFQNAMQAKFKAWKERLKKSGVLELVTYHKTFSYFCDRFEIKCEIQLEPKPGIPPTASHLLFVIDQIKKRKIKGVLIENLYADTVGDKLKQEIPELKITLAPVSVEGESQIMTNEQLIEHLVQLIERK